MRRYSEVVYREIFFDSIVFDDKKHTVWAWYNFDSGYGIVKRYIHEVANIGMTYRGDDAETRPHENFLTSVKAIKDDVETVVNNARAVMDNWENLSDQ
jgi:hypothetical protein